MASTNTTRRGFLRQTLALASVLAAGGRSGCSARSGRPNILIIIADDMGYSDAGCYGGEIGTPSLDRLADNGLRFSQCYSTGRCWPSRTSLLTGYYPQQVRMDPPQGPLPGWARVLPHYLKPLGYRCYHAGKWHLLGAPKPVADGGFDRSYVVHDHDRFFNPKNHELDDHKLDPVPEGSGFYVTTAIADYAMEFLQEHARKHDNTPFCCYLAFTSPHFPLHAMQEDIARHRDRYLAGWDAIRRQRWERLRSMGMVNCDLPPLEADGIPSWNLPREKLSEMIGPGEADRAIPWADLTEQQRAFQATKMAIHAAMIDSMDREIGRVLDQVRSMGVLDETVVFFVSDNGASAEQIIRGDMNDPAAPPGSAKSYLCLGPGWSSAANAPFRLHKSWVHEGGISSPLIVYWPAGIAARGELRRTPCHFIDILPTIVELAGGGETLRQQAATAAPPLPGRSLVSAFAKDGAVRHRYLYFHHIDNRALRVGDWKLVAKGKDGPWELYDLGTDRCEQRNLADQHAEKVREMSSLWQSCEDCFREQAGPSPADGSS